MEALSDVDKWLPADLTHPAPITGYSDWVDIPFWQIMINNRGGNDDLLVGSGSTESAFIMGLNIETQITLPPQYELDPTEPVAAPPAVVGGTNVDQVVYCIPTSPLACEVNTNYPAGFGGPAPTQVVVNPEDGSIQTVAAPQTQWAIAVFPSTAGAYKVSDGKGNASQIADSSPVLDPPSQLAGDIGTAAAVEPVSDIPGDASLPASGGTPTGSATSAGATAAQPVYWYLALASTQKEPGLDQGVEPTFIHVRTIFNAVPSDAFIAEYNGQVATRRQAEYQARLVDLQQTIAAAVAALQDGATFDPVSEIFSQLINNVGITADTFSCSYSESSARCL